MSNADKLAEALSNSLREIELLKLHIDRIDEGQRAYHNCEQWHMEDSPEDHNRSYREWIDEPFMKTKPNLISEARHTLADYRTAKHAIDDDLAIELRLATVNLTNPEDASLLKLIERLISRLQAAPNPWVKIEDIPEEWKDGRAVDLKTYHSRYVNCTFGGGFNSLATGTNRSKWWCPGTANYIDGDRITHVMLPPAPPQEES